MAERTKPKVLQHGLSTNALNVGPGSLTRKFYHNHNNSISQMNNLSNYQTFKGGKINNLMAATVGKQKMLNPADMSANIVSISNLDRF